MWEFYGEGIQRNWGVRGRYKEERRIFESIVQEMIIKNLSYFKLVFSYHQVPLATTQLEMRQYGSKI